MGGTEGMATNADVIIIRQKVLFGFIPRWIRYQAMWVIKCMIEPAIWWIKIYHRNGKTEDLAAETMPEKPMAWPEKHDLVRKTYVWWEKPMAWSEKPVAWWETPSTIAFVWISGPLIPPDYSVTALVYNFSWLQQVMTWLYMICLKMIFALADKYLVLLKDLPRAVDML